MDANIPGPKTTHMAMALTSISAKDAPRIHNTVRLAGSSCAKS